MHERHMNLTMEEADLAVQSYPLVYLEDVVLETNRDNVHSFEIAAAQHVVREHRRFRNELRQLLDQE